MINKRCFPSGKPEILCTSLMYILRSDCETCLHAPEESKHVKYWSNQHHSFLNGQTDSVTITHCPHISQGELFFFGCSHPNSGAGWSVSNRTVPMELVQNQSMVQDTSKAGGPHQWAKVDHPKEKDFFVCNLLQLQTHLV